MWVGRFLAEQSCPRVRSSPNQNSTASNPPQQSFDKQSPLRFSVAVSRQHRVCNFPMPIENSFQHDEMSRKNPGERISVREVSPTALLESPPGQNAMATLGTRFSYAGVRVIVLLNGSIMGTDVFGVQRLDELGGLKRGYSRGVAGLDALLALMREGSNGIAPLPGGLKPPLANDDATKRLLDEQIGDAGNFTNAYVELMRQSLNRSLDRPIHCVRELWSCEHHHLGRAIAAVSTLGRLRDWCETHKLGEGDRILVQAHGQAGLVLALVSNLLCAASTSSRTRLLDLLSAFASQVNRPDITSTIQRVAPLLSNDTLLNGATLDVVTFGMPVRYGWDPSGLGTLLHIVNHRNLRTDGKTWLSKMELPQITMEMPIAWGGDYVQELAVAGSDAVPTTDAAKAANKALWELVEPFDGFERWLECARRAVRIPSEGLGILADYKDSNGSTNVRDHYYGHAAYTRLNTMLFNTTEIVRTLYS
ncbi:MAG: hypothetical protein EWM73_00055 [Nitrospira sp.]|nr:MAG: hypothetical protein EWM73_00055 [Nitrospira sp.]